jgi:hypothetical protein
MISARVPSWRIRQCSACSWMALDSRNRSPSLPPNENIRGCSVLSPGVVCMDSEVGGPPKDVSEGSKPAHHRRGCARVIPDPRRVALGRLDYSWHSATHLEEPRSGLASQPNCSCSFIFHVSRARLVQRHDKAEHAVPQQRVRTAHGLPSPGTQMAETQDGDRPSRLACADGKSLATEPCAIRWPAANGGSQHGSRSPGRCGRAMAKVTIQRRLA